MGLREITPEAAEAFGRSVYERQVRPTLNGAAEPVGCFLSVDLASADWSWTQTICKRRCGCARGGPTQTCSPSASVIRPPASGPASLRCPTMIRGTVSLLRKPVITLTVIDSDGRIRPVEMNRDTDGITVCGVS